MTALECARAYGIAVVFADLGDWGSSCELLSEYDPHAPRIRVNTRILERLDDAARDEFIAHCIGHELYHHREALGEIARLPHRRDREAAADAFARALSRR